MYDLRNEEISYLEREMGEGRLNLWDLHIHDTAPFASFLPKKLSSKLEGSKFRVSIFSVGVTSQNSKKWLQWCGEEAATKMKERSIL